jgi:hypothetical protein
MKDIKNLPENDSVYIVFDERLPGNAIWFNTLKEANKYLKPSNKNLFYSKPIKYCKDF